MTTTDPEGAALLRAILMHLAEDTPRLMYADWLQEHGDEGRAALIRVQVELARLHEAGHGLRATKECPASAYSRANPIAGGQMTPKCRKCEDAFEIECRESELLHAANRREWARVPWGQGGKGDAFDWQLTGPPTVAPPESGVWSASYPLACATPHWHRGFVGRVDVPALSWVCEFVPPKWDNPPEWRVTPWALAVAAAHPVTEWVIPEPLSPVQELPPAVFRLWAEGRELPLAIADVVRDAVREMWKKEESNA